MNYDVDYFIDKFEKIPAFKWTINAFEKREHLFGLIPITKHCAQGFCGITSYNKQSVWYSKSHKEGYALMALFGGVDSTGMIFVAAINNGEDPRYQQPTPKQRILAALRDIKAKQSPPVEQPTKQEPKVIYRTVVIDKAVESLQKSVLPLQ